MDRGDYILTKEGQKNLLWKRRLKRLYFQIQQMPKSKRSINEEGEKFFQQQILKTLQDYKRRAYRSPVIMEITFCLNQKTPPAIHTLAKNYLDLLTTHPKSHVKRKRLLYNDDRLIKILIVNYTLSPDLPSNITIKIDHLKYFFEDLKLVERIIHNNFVGNDFTDSSFDIGEIEQENKNSFTDPYETLKNLKRNKSTIIKNIGRDAYNVMEDFATQDIQKNYLKTGNLSISSLISLFGTYLNKESPLGVSQAIKNILKQSRDFIISPPLALDLKHTPIKDGQTIIFKHNVKTVLGKFKKKFPILSTLKTPVGVIVLYVPPKTQSIDLDNLAKNIIPFVNDIIKPPATFVNSTYSVTRYQFIELPRFDRDSDVGYVRLIFDDPSFGSIWDKVNNVINKWADS